ncbi:cell division protein SepF [Clostridium guangxiense]|uniref:cell division protein SepF n=1 Tax=Clostridium guangxiense TaxID=1662055 RepID=UPI001E41DDCA|nr:cell division protein SepF [Clostridium guangxiense]MCD2345192.1 cell division protein SepF [Clostridium guangxiense]
MASKVLNKVMGIIGLNDEEYEEEESELEDNKNLEEEEAYDYDNSLIQNKKSSKVVNIHTANSIKVSIVKPSDYDEATQICDDLKNRKIVVVNVSELEPKIAQRLLDFMGGASYVLNGELQEIEKGVYLLSPSNVEVSKDLKNELSSKGIFSWSK